MEFKVKMVNSKQLSEIDTRRVIVDTESFSFHDFSCYLKSLFNLNDTDNIYIKVEESDKWIDSEEEWKGFVGSFNTKKESLIKLRVYCGNIHIYVTCDICKNTVAGDRYKCLQCDDYDICQICFQTNPGIHNEHCFILLRKQEDRGKFIRSIPVLNQNSSDFRVLDIDVDSLINREIIEKMTVSTQTEEVSKSEIDKDKEKSAINLNNDEEEKPISKDGDKKKSLNTDDDKEKSSINLNNDAEEKPISKDVDKKKSLNTDEEKEKSSFNLNNDEEEKPISKDGDKKKSLNTDEEKEKTFIDNSNKVTNNSSCSSISKICFDNLPKDILKGLEQLQGMGFVNMDGTLIALLVATNGNISQVLEELDYSSKH